jgi:hypothetical protein
LLNLFAIPVINGVLPKPDGGNLQGIFLDPVFSKMLIDIGVGGEVFVFPISADDETFYPVGVHSRIEDLWTDKITNEGGRALFAKVVGRERCKAKSVIFRDGMFKAKGLEKIDIDELREAGYPAICGAGWYPTGGYTSFGLDRKNIEITIYGFEYETGQDVAIAGRFSGEIEPEKAHTIEHAIIRSLNNYGLCTPKTLRACIERETEELKWSIEIGISKKLPEVFGITRSGICGNPLTYMASYYLTEEFKNRLYDGENLRDSLEKARNKTISRITQEMELSTQYGRRRLEGLKKGMFHDDAPEDLRTLKKIITRFPKDPWH